MATPVLHPDGLIQKLRRQIRLAAAGDAPSVHALRVTLKRLKPLWLALLSIDSEDVALRRDIAVLREMFRTAGRLREPQVLRQWIQLRFGEIPVELAGHLELAEKYALLEWLRYLHLHHENIRKRLFRLRKAIGNCPPDVLRKGMDNVFIELLASLPNTGEAMASEPDLHEIRKRIKGMMACQLLFPNPTLAGWISNANDVAAMIGDRHDAYVASVFLIQTGNPKLMALARRLQRELDKSFPAARERLVILLKDMPAW